MKTEAVQKLDLDEAERTLLQELRTAQTRYNRAKAQLKELQLDGLSEAELVKEAPVEIQEALKAGREGRKRFRSLAWQWAKDVGALSSAGVTRITWKKFQALQAADSLERVRKGGAQAPPAPLEAPDRSGAMVLQARGSVREWEGAVDELAAEAQRLDDEGRNSWLQEHRGLKAVSCALLPAHVP
jgi:hypothetical protein